MDPREYDWQMGDLADQRIYPDERYMQPPPRDDPWPQQFLPSPGDAAPWKPEPTQLARWPVDPSQMSANEAAAFRTQSRYRNALAHDPESNRMGALAEMVAPQSPLDYALLASGPVAKAASVPVRAALYGGAMALDPDKAEAMLAGKMSKTANLGLLKKAEEMLQYGKTGPEIRKETTWFPTAGGILKYEIPDYRTGWVPGEDPSKIPRMFLPAGAPAERVYRHPAAYEAYPDLANVPVTITPQLGMGVRGGFQPPEYVGDQPKVFLAPASSAQMKSVLVHELFGHGVQNLEPSWPIGGNPTKILLDMKEGTPQWDIYQRMLDYTKKPISFEEYADMLKGSGLNVTEAGYKSFLEATQKGISPHLDNKLRELAAHEAYKKGAGEEEARALQARMNLSPKKLREIPFEQSLNTPFEQQILNFREPLKPQPKPVTPQLPPPTMGSLADLQLSKEPLTGFAPEGKGVIGDLFDYSKVHEIPAVKQYDLPRYEPPRGVSERVQELVGNKKVEQKMLDYIEKGKDIKAETFYYNEPLREAFVAELGKKKGEPAFARYMDYVAATSPRSDVETNARNASYYYWLERQGKPVPPQGGVNPQPYGHMAQNLHRENAEKIRSGEYFDVVNNPKPLSFSQNLQGNFSPVTVDAHAFKLPAILARNPEFLAGSLKLEKGAPTINPTKMYESGDLTMREAAQRPVYWAARPNRNEYGAMEQYYKRLAAEVGMTPAQTQAAAWAGGGKVTGLESVAGDPFMRSVENRAIKTAAERGISPEEALSQMMRGKAPLLGLGGAAIGSLAAQDEYR